MTIPSYSNTGRLGTKVLLKKYLTCYVEEKEDKMYWEKYFSLLTTDLRIKFRPAGNCRIIDKWIDKIMRGNKKVMVIRDSDYLDVFQSKVAHPRIIYTFGYSLENSVYSARAVNKTVRYLSVSDCSIAKDYDDWLRNNYATIENLVIMDIADMMFSKKKSVLGDSGGIYIDNPKDCNISISKVQSRFNQFTSNFTNVELQEARKKYLGFRKRKHLLLRGHVLTLLVVNYINRQIDLCKPTGKKTKVTTMSVTPIISSQLDNTTIDSSEYNFYTRKVREIEEEQKAI